MSATADKKIKIFMVDDDQLFLDSLFHFLTMENEQNMEVKKFNTGEECLKCLDQHPDIIILDYYLNSSVSAAMNGMEVLKKIKSTLPDTRVLMLSSQDNIEIAMETIKNGAFDYVSKSPSAFIRIKNLVRNISRNILSTDKLNRRISYSNIINIAVIVIFVLLFILSRIF